jgi:hypothetical protein
VVKALYLHPITLVLLVSAVLVGGVLVGCKASRSPTRGAATLPLPGYLLTEADRVEYLQWTDAGGRLSGQLQLAHLPTSGAYTVLTDSYPFTGTRSGSSISLSVDVGGHTAVTWTGSLTDDTLQLVAPATSGLLETNTYQRATIAGYNQATITFKTMVKAKADVSAADTSLTTALAKLHTDVTSLTADSKLDEATKGFDPYWASVQAAFQAAQTAAQQPFDCARAADLANARAAVGRGLTAVEGDDRSLRSMASKVSSDSGAVSTDVATSKTQFATLQTALAVPAASGVTVQNAPEVVTSTLTDAQAQLDASQAAMSSAQGHFGDYLSRATDLDTQAASLVAQVACPPPSPAAAPPAPAPASAQPAAPSSPLPTTPFYAVVAPRDGVNVRPQPGSADRTGCLPQGSIVRITAGPRSANGYDWYYAHDFGWIAGSYLTSRSSPAVVVPGDAASTVRAFYDALDRGDTATAWSLTSRQYQASVGGDRAQWAANFATTRSVSVSTVAVQGTSVTVNYVSVDAGPVVRGWSVTWTVVSETGGLRLDHAYEPTSLPVCA